jgi:hypothetical protein
MSHVLLPGPGGEMVLPGSSGAARTRSSTSLFLELLSHDMLQPLISASERLGVEVPNHSLAAAAAAVGFGGSGLWSLSYEQLVDLEDVKVVASQAVLARLPRRTFSTRAEGTGADGGDGGGEEEAAVQG